MTHNQKVMVFAAVIVATATVLWGVNGIFQLLPGPNPK